MARTLRNESAANQALAEQAKATPVRRAIRARDPWVRPPGLRLSTALRLMAAAVLLSWSLHMAWPFLRAALGGAA